MFKANKYDRIYPDRRKEIDFLLKYLKGKTILDIGGGTGIISEELNKRGFKCVNVEPQKEMAEISEKRGVDTFCSTIENFWMKSPPIEKFENAIMVFDVFNFLDSPKRAFKNIAKLLKGRFIFSYWNNDIKKSGWEVNWKLLRLSRKIWTGNKVKIDFWFPFFHEQHNLNVYPDKYINYLLKKNRFKIIEKIKNNFTTTIIAEI